MRRLKIRETEAMPLVTRTPMAVKSDHRDLTNRVGRGHVCALSGFDVGAGVDLIEVVQALAKEKLTT